MSSKAKKNEAQALIRYAREGDWKKAEDLLVKMKGRGVDLHVVSIYINNKVVDERDIQEFIMDRIKYIETGQEDSYESKRRIEDTSAVAKGRRKSRRKTHRRKTHRRKTNKRR
jgi:pentatricopeptide repeat protein